MAECKRIDPDTSNGPKCGCTEGACALNAPRPGHPNVWTTRNEDWPTVYATNEQLARLAALACDAVTGIEFRTDDSDLTAIQASLLDIDNDMRTRHFNIYTDGRCEETT